MYSLTKNPQSTTSNSGFYTVKQVLTDDEINVLTKFSQTVKMEKAGILDSVYDDIDCEIRNSLIFWLKPESQDKQIQNIFKKIVTKILEVNSNVFQYELTDIEPIQYTRYLVGDFYKPHIDMNNGLFLGGTCRKLSFSIQLTDPSEYQGGDLCSCIGETQTIACKKKGSMTFFSSFTLHEVKPVTQGVRNSLVGWCWGPKFK